MKAFVKENTWLKRGGLIDFGWGNGYVAIPKEHPLHGKDYNEIHKLLPKLYVNGGLTFAESADSLDWVELPKGSGDAWIVGFDTAHSFDTLKKWNKKKVLEETEKLKNQLLEYVAPTKLNLDNMNNQNS